MVWHAVFPEDAKPTSTLFEQVSASTSDLQKMVEEQPVKIELVELGGLDKSKNLARASLTELKSLHNFLKPAGTKDISLALPVSGAEETAADLLKSIDANVMGWLPLAFVHKMHEQGKDRRNIFMAHINASNAEERNHSQAALFISALSEVIAMLVKKDIAVNAWIQEIVQVLKKKAKEPRPPDGSFERSVAYLYTAVATNYDLKGASIWSLFNMREDAMRDLAGVTGVGIPPSADMSPDEEEEVLKIIGFTTGVWESLLPVPAPSGETIGGRIDKHLRPLRNPTAATEAVEFSNPTDKDLAMHTLIQLEAVCHKLMLRSTALHNFHFPTKRTAEELLALGEKPSSGSKELWQIFAFTHGLDNAAAVAASHADHRLEDRLETRLKNSKLPVEVDFSQALFFLSGLRFAITGTIKDRGSYSHVLALAMVAAKLWPIAEPVERGRVDGEWRMRTTPKGLESLVRSITAIAGELSAAMLKKPDAYEDIFSAVGNSEKHVAEIAKLLKLKTTPAPGLPVRVIPQMSRNDCAARTMGAALRSEWWWRWWLRVIWFSEF